MFAWLNHSKHVGTILAREITNRQGYRWVRVAHKTRCLLLGSQPEIGSEKNRKCAQRICLTIALSP